MNDDPGPSSAARHLPPRSDAEHSAGERGMLPEGSSDSTTHNGSASQKQEKRRRGLAKKLEFISHLQKNLDMIVFVYICTLYYMECSLFRFLLRLLPHYSFLTPKDGLLLPAEHPHIYTIFVPSVLCMLAHIFFALPEAGEATRGYLHGGVIIDFIGQKPPTTKLAFLFLDLVILGVQCLMLAVHQEREKLKKAAVPSLRTFSSSGDQTAQAVTAESTQDHDAEERGVLRDGVVEIHSSQEAERSPTDGDPTGDTYSSAVASADMVDILRSGNAVLSNFHVIHAVRSVGGGAQSAAAYSLRTLGYSATLAALAAERRSRLIQQQQR
ncbi:DSC E3 ubiquitin ligase complex subunit 4 [Achaetomium macrosporum]|uniref:DSC E3 ubiquitin ligase complex subunit 4 n=1 Tax=Achaetomium macrosporum TaxID=79813 RepID=A0AAN7CGY1_9PEZI|nr:DSC E3 ubiquitin ligase complex subunit 4 [Achaetomium macrosporum]